MRPPVTNRGTAREIVEFAAHALAPEQRQALELWIGGASFDEIAAALTTSDAKAAERLVRAALERIRRHFRGQES